MENTNTLEARRMNRILCTTELLVITVVYSQSYWEGMIGRSICGDEESGETYYVEMFLTMDQAGYEKIRYATELKGIPPDLKRGSY